MFYLLNPQETMLPVLETPKEVKQKEDCCQPPFRGEVFFNPQTEERSAVTPQSEERSNVTPQFKERSNVTPQSKEVCFNPPVREEVFFNPPVYKERSVRTLKNISVIPSNGNLNSVLQLQKKRKTRSQSSVPLLDGDNIFKLEPPLNIKNPVFGYCENNTCSYFPRECI